MGKVITAAFGRSARHAHVPPGEIVAASAFAGQASKIIRRFEGGTRPSGAPAFADNPHIELPVRNTGERPDDFAMRCALRLCRDRIAVVRAAERLWKGNGDHACGRFAAMTLSIPYENVLCERMSRPARPDIVMPALEHSGKAIEALRAFQRGLHEAGRRCSVQALRPVGQG